MKMAIRCLFAITVLLVSCRNKPEQNVQSQMQPISRQDTIMQPENGQDTLGIYIDKYRRVLRDESLYQSPVAGVGFPDMDSMVLGEVYHKQLLALSLPYYCIDDHCLMSEYRDYIEKINNIILYSHYSNAKKNKGIGFTEYNGFVRCSFDSFLSVIDGKFPTNGEYQFLTGIFDTEYEGLEFSRMYYTCTLNGNMIDMLPAYYSRLDLLLMHTVVFPDLVIRKTAIQVDRVDFTMPVDSNEIDDLRSPIDDIIFYGDTIIGRRIDSYYQLTPDGRFELRRQLEFSRREYTFKELDYGQAFDVYEFLQTLPQDSANARWTLDMDRQYHPSGGRHNRSVSNLSDTGTSDPAIRFPSPSEIQFDSLFTRRIGWAQLPFYADTSGVPPSRWYRDPNTVSAGRPSVDLRDFPSISVDEFGQSVKTGDPDSLTANFIRLDYLLPSNGRYLLVYGTYGTPREPWWGYYATFDPVSGRLIDHLLAKEWGMGMTTLESEISADLHIRTTQIDFLDTYVFSTPGVPIRGQRIDNYYRLTPEGRFERERTERFAVRPYDITELEHTRLFETRETQE
ncbi:MAG: hypothetical protein IJ338_01470 [Bacteroidaceae bacterium]|nr:hypothetical protein [Bacteroidaceae bacterium]